MIRTYGTRPRALMNWSVAGMATTCIGTAPGASLRRRVAYGDLAMGLLTLLAAGVLAAFYIRDLKPALRAAGDTLHVAHPILTELFVGLPEQARAP